MLVAVLFAAAAYQTAQQAMPKDPYVIQGNVPIDFETDAFTTLTGVPLCGVNVTTLANATFTGSFFSNVTNTSTPEGAGYGLSSGDFNNDSVKDIIIGAPFNPLDNVTGDAGRVFALYGSLPFRAGGNLSLISNITVNGSTQGGQLGKAVLGGDITGDRIDDLIIGEPGQNSTKVYVFFGSSALGFIHTTPANANLTLNITSLDDIALAVGDLNNDGISDLAIGQPDFPDNNQSRGKVDVVFGRSVFPKQLNLSADANATINGTSNGDNFGLVVVTGDLNNDSIMDLVVGAPGRNVSGIGQVGVVSIFSGSGAFTHSNAAAADSTISGESSVNGSVNSFARTGSALFARGDVNNDTRKDLLIGAPSSRTPQNDSEAGAVYILFGQSAAYGALGLASANVTLYGNLGNGTGNSNGEHTGTSLFSRDYNGDGVDDINIGAPRASNCNVTNAGIVYQIHGRNAWARQINLTSGANRTIGGAMPNAYLGFTLGNGSQTISSPSQVSFVVSGSPSMETRTQSADSNVYDFDEPPAETPGTTPTETPTTTPTGGGGGGPTCFNEFTCLPQCHGSGGDEIGGPDQGICYHIAHQNKGSHGQCPNHDQQYTCAKAATAFQAYFQTASGSALYSQCCGTESTPTPTPTPYCGNYEQEAGEECDPPGTDCTDSNGNLMTNEDGSIVQCSATCKCAPDDCDYKVISNLFWECVPGEAKLKERTTDTEIGTPKPPCKDKDPFTSDTGKVKNCPDPPQPNPKNKCFKPQKAVCKDNECDITPKPPEYIGDAGCYTATAGTPGPSFSNACSLSFGNPGGNLAVGAAGSTIYQFEGYCDEECKLQCPPCDPVGQMLTSLFPQLSFALFTGATPGAQHTIGNPGPSSEPTSLLSGFCQNNRCEPGDESAACQCPAGSSGTQPNCVPCTADSTAPECQTCPTSFFGNPPDCIRCPPDSVDPQCRCPPGSTNVGCPCPAGMTGVQPSCENCPPGSSDPECLEFPGPIGQPDVPPGTITTIENPPVPPLVQPPEPPVVPPPQPCIVTTNPGSTEFTQPGGPIDDDDLPPGYDIITTFRTNCPSGMGEFGLNINVPDHYRDIRAFLQTEETTQVVISETTNPTCGAPATIAQTITESRDSAYRLSEMQTIVSREGVVQPGQTLSLDSAGYAFQLLQPLGSGRVLLSMPRGDVPYPANPSVRIMGTPLLLTFDDAVSGAAKVTFPVAVPQFIDETSIGVYAKLGDSWRQIENVEIKDGKATATVNDIGLFLTLNNDGQYEALFALMGIYCASCATTKLEKVYDGGALESRHAVVLAHGITTDAMRWRSLVDDFAQTQQPFQVWLFSYPLNKQPDEVGRELASQLEQHATKFDKLHFITHSLGGIETQLALNYARENNFSFVRKVDNAIFAGQPGLGSPAAEVYGRLFAFLLNLRSTAMLFSKDSQMLQTAVEGRQVPRTPGTEYFIIAGRQPYKFTYDLFVKDGQFDPNDGIITTRSARTVGGKEITDRCEHYFEVPLTHTDLIDAWLPRRIMSKIIAKDVAREHPDLAIVGYNKIVNIGAQCVPGTYIVVGKRISEDATADPLLCKCGNGVCGEGENEINCPDDCAHEYQYGYLCKVAPWLLYPILFIMLIVSTLYCGSAIKKHARGGGATALLTVTTLVGVGFVATHLLCKSAPLIGYIILAFTGALLVFTEAHLQLKHARAVTIDDGPAHELEEMLKRAKGK